jgi:hypothetical protein
MVDERRGYKFLGLRWDLTVNIPSMVAIFTAATMLYKAFSGVVVEANLLYKQHKLMWAELVAAHPEAALRVKE